MPGSPRHPLRESKCCVLCPAVPQPLVGDSPGQELGWVRVSGFCSLSVRALFELPRWPALSAVVFLLRAKLSLLSSH